jgi:GT2 family glycosyltransferase
MRNPLKAIRKWRRKGALRAYYQFWRKTRKRVLIGPEDERRLTKITAIIKTFERPDCLDRCIRSLRKFYPMIPVIVADDSVAPGRRDDVRYIRLAPDSGSSAGRNAALMNVATPYFLNLDDDICLDEGSDLLLLLKVLEDGVADIAGGDRTTFGIRSPWHGTILREGTVLRVLPGCRSDHGSYQRCDIVHNFFVARTEMVRKAGGWDAELKVNAHTEFFLRMKQYGARVVFCPAVTAEHRHVETPHYAKYRRRTDFRRIFMRKYGIERWHNMDKESFVLSDLADN